jgi:DNA-binding transcriptional LysR family regulator
MELRQLRYFVVLAEELHFGRASNRLGVGQPILTRSVQELERELGHALLLRESGVLGLTERGRSFADGARRILGEGRHAGAYTLPGAEVEPGLRVGQLTSATSRFIPQMISVFRERHPDLMLHLSTGNTPDLVASVRSRSCDIAFVRLPLDAGDAMDQLVMEDEPLRVVLAPTNPLASQAIIHPRDLLQQPFVFFPRDLNPDFHDDILGRLSKAAGTQPRIVTLAPTLESVLSSVLICNAVSVVTAAHAHDAPRYGLSVRPLAPQIGVKLGLVWRRDSRTSQVESFIRVAQSLAPVETPRVTGALVQEVQ